MTTPLRVPFAVLMLACSFPASAHLMPEKQGSVNVVGNNAYIVMTVPVSALAGFDDNQDGMIDVPELVGYGEALRAQVLERFGVTDDRQAPTGSITWLLTPNTGDTAQAPSSYLLAMQSLSFASPPGNLRIRYELFGTAGNDRQLALTATRGTEREVVVLTPGHGQSRLFRGGLEVFADFVRIGARHILGGWDHLAFLLTIVAAGAGVRCWFSVITSFTIAHSVTLALSIWGVLRLPSAIVEPAILASIVVMGVDAIRNRHRGLGVRAAMVFACGLIHGLGFASAIAGTGIDERHSLHSLAGFNVGIELGQALFVGGALGLVSLVRRMLAARRGPAAAAAGVA